MPQIIVSIGKTGIISEELNDSRFANPRAGDWLQTPGECNVYPLNTEDGYSRIVSVNKEAGLLHMVCGAGSAFMCESGDLDVSGGPFTSVPIILTIPQRTQKDSEFWNWGDNSPGAAQGCYFKFPRLVYTLTVPPKDFRVRNIPTSTSDPYEPCDQTEWLESNNSHADRQFVLFHEYVYFDERTCTERKIEILVSESFVGVAKTCLVLRKENRANNYGAK